jgi:hypothetical protein
MAPIRLINTEKPEADMKGDNSQEQKHAIVGVHPQYAEILTETEPAPIGRNKAAGNYN